MPLHYDLRTVKANWKDDAIWPITNALIMGTMSVGMRSIDETNWKEFYTRVHIIESIHGHWLLKEGKPRLITPQDVYDHIGLNTNATHISNAKFKNDIDRRFREQAKHMIKCQPVEENDWFTSGETSWEEYYNEGEEEKV